MMQVVYPTRYKYRLVFTPWHGIAKMKIWIVFKGRVTDMVKVMSVNDDLARDVLDNMGKVPVTEDFDLTSGGVVVRVDAKLRKLLVRGLEKYLTDPPTGLETLTVEE